MIKAAVLVNTIVTMQCESLIFGRRFFTLKNTQRDKTFPTSPEKTIIIMKDKLISFSFAKVLSIISFLPFGISPPLAGRCLSLSVPRCEECMEFLNTH
jgi:hypothetical protein